jgi:hypothetical protein
MRLALIIAVTISILAPHQREAPSVVGAGTFSSSFGKFSISLPSPTGFGPLTIPTPFGNGRGQLFQWETKEATFGVGYADAFQPLQDPEVARDFFKSATERFNKVATANSGSVAIVKQITLDKHPGIEQRVELFTGMVIQRTYIASRRVYEVVAVMKNNQKTYESVVLGVLDSFKLLTEADAQAQEAKKAAKAEPSPLPQTPAVERAGSDASDEGLRGRVRTVLTESQDLSGTWSVQGRKRNSFDTYNEHGNKLRTELYDFKGNLYRISVYGFIDGGRVVAFRTIEHEYDPPPVAITAAPGNADKKFDRRYDHRFEFKYDDKKRLTERKSFQSNGDVWLRYVYKYNGSQKEELVYTADGTLNQRYLYTLDDKGNEVELTIFERSGSIRVEESYTYEFDSKGNWTKRTTSRVVTKDGRQQLVPYNFHFRTITYY